MLGDIQKVKEESGLQEQDWRAFIEQKYKYPAEVQTVVEAPNEEHDDCEEIFEEYYTPKEE